MECSAKNGCSYFGGNPSFSVIFPMHFPVTFLGLCFCVSHFGDVPGAFDLFHVGHLNLLRRSKSRCEYLIAGILTDELYEHFKKKKPVIPYEQRAAIVSSITYVDRVVPVDFSNTVKIDAWKRYHYDCHFSGNDHGADWTHDLQQLREVGADMEFFEYTRATSSSDIKVKMN